MWEARRKVVSQGFHSAWLRGLTAQMVADTKACFDMLDAQAEAGEPVDMESLYLNVALDIVGSAVFGVSFASGPQTGDRAQSPIVKAVYRVLKETAYRTENPANLLLARLPADVAGAVSAQAAEFQDSMRALDACLDEAIAEAMERRSELDVDALQGREGGSLLRFLVDLRGEDVESAQLKDDLRTLLIAGHETVASVLTWATYELMRNPDVLSKALQEIEAVLGDRMPAYGDIRELSYLRLVVAEALRMYPAPPSLFRRALAEDRLPRGAAAAEVPLARGTLVQLQVAMLHRNPLVYDQPDRFWPERWQTAFGGDGASPGWGGYDPSKVTGLYPSEAATDYAFIPFAGGEYRCVGDQFAVMEATVVLAMLLKRYEFNPLQKDMDEIGLDLAATIHTKNGLQVRLKRRPP